MSRMAWSAPEAVRPLHDYELSKVDLDEGVSLQFRGPKGDRCELVLSGVREFLGSNFTLPQNVVFRVEVSDLKAVEPKDVEAAFVRMGGNRFNGLANGLPESGYLVSLDESVGFQMLAIVSDYSFERID